MKIFVTGTAGFIGSALAKTLAKRGDEVVGFDNINDYYDVELKFDRLRSNGIDEWSDGKVSISKTMPNLAFIKGDLADLELLERIFKEHKFDAVVNLAAQAGVRYSLINPHSYTKSNVVGFVNLLEVIRHSGVKNFVYASSSSVYGLNEKMPYSEHHETNHQVSVYAATKKANEMLAHTYSHLYDISTTGLRFFTVYGPWGRPDMAPSLFVGAALRGESIKVFNHGEMMRDFTYIDDIVDGVIKVIDKPATSNPKWDAKNPDPASSKAPFRIYNIGCNNPVKLMDFIKAIETKLGFEIKKEFVGMQDGDVVATYADVSELVKDFGYKPTTTLKDGVGKFVDWYKSYFKDIK